METPPDLEELVLARAGLVEALIRRYAGSLLRLETIDDLAQGSTLRLLESGGGFEWRGDDAFDGWVATIVRNYLNDRRSYWNAARRNAGHLLRVSLAGPETGTTRGVEPISSRTGPLTFAERRDQIDVAMQALSTLLPRDQEILALERTGASIGEIAESLGLSTDTAGKARLRALERFRRAFELYERGG
ncbi:MAG: sigma-70 family RNA polymerase sigma factor [Planctomycetota bacterium]